MNIGIKQLLIGLIVVSALCATSVNAKWYTDENGTQQWRDEVTRPKGKSSVLADEKAAIARTRRHVQMLDDLYKTAVVAITQHYVTDPSILSAASAAKALFAAMKTKGWHDARLLGFTDVLTNPGDNAPKDDFERTAKQKILAGASSYEAIETQGGNKIFRMATTLPVVMEKCVMCHANFEGVEGAIGAISYSLPLIK